MLNLIIIELAVIIGLMIFMAQRLAEISSNTEGTDDDVDISEK